MVWCLLPLLLYMQSKGDIKKLMFGCLWFQRQQERGASERCLLHFTKAPQVWCHSSDRVKTVPFLKIIQSSGKQGLPRCFNTYNFARLQII